MWEALFLILAIAAALVVLGLAQKAGLDMCIRDRYHALRLRRPGGSPCGNREEG